MNSFSVLLALALSVPAFAADPALPAGHASPHAGSMLPGKAAPEMQLAEKGTVLSVQSVPQYTYIEVMQNNKPAWLAASTVAVKKGDVIRFDSGMVMTDFYSKSLKRTFPRIAFVNRVVVSNEKK